MTPVCSEGGPQRLIYIDTTDVGGRIQLRDLYLCSAVHFCILVEASRSSIHIVYTYCTGYCTAGILAVKSYASLHTNRMCKRTLTLIYRISVCYWPFSLGTHRYEPSLWIHSLGKIMGTFWVKSVSLLKWVFFLSKWENNFQFWQKMLVLKKIHFHDFSQRRNLEESRAVAFILNHLETTNT